MKKIFNLEVIKKESGLSADALSNLEKNLREEFKDDEMMFELHFVRVLKALKEGWITLKEISSENRVS